MTGNQRIVLNVIATYGRSLVGVACGIFSTRWVLMALGQVDFGLYGLIGSLSLFMTFVNIQFSLAISRYYAYSVGQAGISESEDKGLEECRAWFSVALFIHLVIPLLLIAICFPLGEYAIRHGIVSVPSDRISACLWVWRFTVCSCFVGMVTVPFQAMYTAKQYIAELTIYGFAQVIIRTVGFYYMASNPRDWLVEYGFFMCMVAVVPQLIIAVRACQVFKECRLRVQEMFSVPRMKKIASYAGWLTFGGVGYLASRQCMSVLMNNAFGSRVTGSFTVGQNVAGEAAALSGAMQSAFTPAIASACGANQLDRMREMAYMVCKVGTLFTLLFAVPFSLEMDEILNLWLKEPPPFAAEICIATLAFIVVEKLSTGHGIAINAVGRIAAYQVLHGLMLCSVLLLAFISVILDLGVAITAYTMPISCLLVVVCDVGLARKIVGMKWKRWFNEIFLPLCVLTIAVSAIGWIPHCFMPQSILRLVLTTVFCFLSILPLAWIFVLSKDECLYLKNQLLKVRRKLCLWKSKAL